MSAIIDHQSGSEKLFFADFINKLLFGYIYQVSSLRDLILQLQTNGICRQLGLSSTPYWTFKDGFSRFESCHFKQLFENALEQISLKSVACLDEMGVFRIIDGSLFPTLIQMNWTSYRKNKNAFKLHLEFELNRMIPTEFWIGTGKSSERKFLESVLEKGITYIADRGYFSFDLMAKLEQAEAYFVMRVKDNVVYKTLETLPIEAGEVSRCFKYLVDETVIFTNDKEQNRYRLISFQAYGNQFRIATNRFDLSTLQIMILYAYRWQIELFFKFIKRTINGIHLFNHSENGVEIQFYMLMTVAVLMLKLKQDCQSLEQESKEKETENEKKTEKKNQSPPEWIKEIGKVFYESWKITKNWLTVLKNSLAKVLDNQILRQLNSS